MFSSARSSILAAIVVTITRGCGTQDSGGAASSPPSTVHAATAPAVAAAPARPSPPGNVEEEEAPPTEKFTDAERAFNSAKDALLKGYYNDGLREDDLYRGALQGMLEHAEPTMRKWNKLLSPTELAEMRTDLKGEVVGVGVQIQFDSASGYTDVMGAIPGSPAEKAGLVLGDKILSVNGKLYKGMSVRDIVSDIRGKAGEVVTLSVLRADKILSVPLKREAITFEPATAMMLPEGVGYLRVHGFNAKTTAAVKASLDALTQKSATSLVIDLRGNQGGLLPDAVSTAELLLPSGVGIVKIEKRGHKEESFVSKGPGFLPAAPMAVLVDGDTSSSAELLTAALQEGRHARVVGARTFGKWTVQTIDDLPNGYAIKYTIGLFRSPAGRSFEGVGLTPDVDVTMDEKAIGKAHMTLDPEKRLAADVQLRTAVSLLRH